MILSPVNSVLPQITMQEVENAMKEMNNNKAQGNYVITKDILWEGGSATITQLMKLYNQILQEKRIPQSWKEAKIKSYTKRVMRQT